MNNFIGILEVIRERISVYNTDGHLIFSNRTASEQLCGKECRACSSLIDRCRAMAEPVESVIQCESGNYCEARAYPDISEAGDAGRIVVIGNDATLKMSLREETLAACRSLAISKLTSSMAHEINNPCAHLLLNLDLFKDIFDDAKPIFDEHLKQHGDFLLGNLPYTELSSCTGHILDEMMTGTRQIVRIIQDLRRFSRNDPVDLEGAFHLNDSVFTAIRLTSRQLKHATENLTLDCTSSLPLTHGDACQIERVLVNLILNACQALRGREDGITISTKFIEDEKVNMVSIADEGVGVEPALLPHLCDPFFTTKQSSEGVGLGLTVARDIVKEHRGSFEFKPTSETGGLTVVVKLPIFEDLKK